MAEEKTAASFLDRLPGNTRKAGAWIRAKWSELFSDGKEGALNTRLTLLIVSGILALFFCLLLWWQERDYRPLYGQSEQYNVAHIVDLLDKKGIPYRLHPGTGQLLVPSGRLAEARMAMATNGVITPVLTGARWLDEKQGLGGSHFIEQKRFLKGLEEELTRTVMSLEPVRSARVHLAVSGQTAFLRDTPPTRASVYLELYRGNRLEPAQVEGVIRLISASVPGLEEQDVTVIDQHGNLLSRYFPSDGDNPISLAWIEARQRIEGHLELQVGRILDAIVGPGNYRVDLAVELDMDRRELSAETYGPETAIRSEALESQGLDQKDQAATPGDNAGEGGVQKQTRNYEVNRQFTNQVQQPGKVQRLHLAILLNAKALPDSPDNTMSELQALVVQAVGFDSGRGDGVSIRALPFSDAPSPITAGEGEQNLLADYGWVGLITLFLLLGTAWAFILLLRRRRKPVDGKLTEGEPGMTGAAKAGEPPTWDRSIDAQLEQTRSLALQEPERAAAVLKQWLDNH